MPLGIHAHAHAHTYVDACVSRPTRCACACMCQAGVALAELDYVLVSYVCIYVAKQRGDPAHEATCDEWQRLLKGGVRAMLVSERSEETAACGMMETRGVTVERLIEQSLGKDERQPGVSCRECHGPAPWLTAHALGCGTHSGRAAVTAEPLRASMGDCGGAAVRPRQSRRVFGLSNTQAERLPLGRRDPPHAAPLARRRRQGAHLHQRALRGAQAQARRRGGRRRQPDQVVLVSLRGVRATPNLHAACVVREPYCSAPLLREFVCAHVRVTSHVRACGRVCARLPGARRHTRGGHFSSARIDSCASDRRPPATLTLFQ